jgi:hypothetical protein
MADEDPFRSDHDLLDDEPKHVLTLDDRSGLGRMLEPAEEVLQRFG